MKPVTGDNPRVRVMTPDELGIMMKARFEQHEAEHRLYESRQRRATKVFLLSMVPFPFAVWWLIRILLEVPGLTGVFGLLSFVYIIASIWGVPFLNQWIMKRIRLSDVTGDPE